jgi:tRNA nucleotidyltransferase (CCA-adding enzyme)
MKERHPDATMRHLRRLRLLRFLHPGLLPGKRTERVMAVLPRAIRDWKRLGPGTSVDRPLLGVMALLSDAPQSAIDGSIHRLQLSAAQSGALEWAGQRTSHITKLLSSAAPLRPSQIYRLLSGMPDEALAMVLAKGRVDNSRAENGRLMRRLRRFLTRDRHARTTINGETLKDFGLRPGPHFKRILDQLLDERLDGRITAAGDERARARTLAEQYG